MGQFATEQAPQMTANWQAYGSWAGGDYKHVGVGIGFSGDGRTLVAESHANKWTSKHNQLPLSCPSPFGVFTVYTRASTSHDFTFQNAMFYRRNTGVSKEFYAAKHRLVRIYQHYIDLCIVHT
jgi:hypothetical protein